MEQITVFPLSVQQGSGDEINHLDVGPKTLKPAPRSTLRQGCDCIFDVVTPLPACCWACVSLFAVAFGYGRYVNTLMHVLTTFRSTCRRATDSFFRSLTPSVFRIGWATPIISGLFSSFVGLYCAHDLIMYHRRIIFVPIFATETERLAFQNRSTAWSKPKFFIASLSFVLSLAFGITFDRLGADIVGPCRGDGTCKTSVGKTIRYIYNSTECMAKGGVTWTPHCSAECKVECEPCNGRCTDECAKDPHCEAWATKMVAAFPALSMCPLPDPKALCSGEDTVGADDGYCATHATFSCSADGGWLIITSIICLAWAIANGVIYKRRLISSKHVLDDLTEP